jgi:hypothetical protein
MVNELERKWIKTFVLTFRSLLLLDPHDYEILYQLQVNKEGYD